MAKIRRYGLDPNKNLEELTFDKMVQRLSGKPLCYDKNIWWRGNLAKNAKLLADGISIYLARMSLVDYADPRNYDTHVHRFFEAQENFSDLRNQRVGKEG